MKNIILSAAAATAIIAVSASAISCTGKGWSDEEREIILGQGETMRVLTVDSEADSIVLRRHCKELTIKELNDNVAANVSANNLHLFEFSNLFFDPFFRKFK